MASRRKRKRERLRAEATAGAASLGGWGEGLPVRRGDLVLLQRAAAGGWAVPVEVRSAAILDLGRVLEGQQPRVLLAAARAVLAMEADNLRRRG